MDSEIRCGFLQTPYVLNFIKEPGVLKKAIISVWSLTRRCRHRPWHRRFVSHVCYHESRASNQVITSLMAGYPQSSDVQTHFLKSKKYTRTLPVESLPRPDLSSSYLLCTFCTFLFIRVKYTKHHQSYWLRLALQSRHSCKTVSTRNESYTQCCIPHSSLITNVLRHFFTIVIRICCIQNNVL